MSISLLESLDRLIASAPKAQEAKECKCKKCGKPCKHGKLCQKCESLAERGPFRIGNEDEEREHNETQKISKLRADSQKGELPAYAWPGGYPMFYLDKGNNVLCPECANKNDEHNEPLVEYDVNWEDENLSCDHCSKHIPSAYGDDTDESRRSIESQIDALMEKKAHRNGVAPKKTRASDLDDPKGQMGKHESIESMIDEKLRKMCGKPEHEKWPIHTHGKKSHKKVTRYAKVMGGGSIPGWGDKHEALDERRKPGQCFKTVRKALGREHKGGDKDALAAWIKRKNTHESTRDRVEAAIDQLMS